MDTGAETDDPDRRLTELRSVVSYLRKEKEIVDLQLELSKQENARFKTQVDHLTQALEETRIALTNVGALPLVYILLIKALMSCRNASKPLKPFKIHPNTPN